MAENSLQCDFSRLERVAAAQCFAVFMRRGTLKDFERYYNFYKSQTHGYGGVSLVSDFSSLKRAEKEGKLACALTVENLGFIGGVGDVDFLKARGVIMASLVWNEENSLAYPNGATAARCGKGLKPFGRKVLRALDKNGIIVDISHLSDGGALEILRGRKIPAVASHSNCDSVFAHPRNLTDEIIRAVADCGGAVGLNAYSRFSGGGFAALYEHFKRLICVGGEDCPALGLDFDGAPRQSEFYDCGKVPAFLEYLHKRGIPPRIIEKVALGNFSRVLRQVAGG